MCGFILIWEQSCARVVIPGPMSHLSLRSKFKKINFWTLGTPEGVENIENNNKFWLARLPSLF